MNIRSFYAKHFALVGFLGSIASIVSLTLAIVLLGMEDLARPAQVVLVTLIALLSLFVLLSVLSWCLGYRWAFGLTGKVMCNQFTSYCDLCAKMLDFPDLDDKGVITVQTPVTFNPSFPSQRVAFSKYMLKTFARLGSSNVAYRRIVVLFDGDSNNEAQHRATTFAVELLDAALRKSASGFPVDLDNVHLAFMHQSLFPTRFLASTDTHSISDNVYSVGFTETLVSPEGNMSWEFTASAHLIDQSGATGGALRKDLISLWRACPRATVVSLGEFFGAGRANLDRAKTELESEIAEAVTAAREAACPCPITKGLVAPFVTRIRREIKLWQELCKQCS